MRVVCISDTHAMHRRIEVPDGDVLVHVGDITREGEVDTVYDFSLWLAELPHRQKIVVPGNHDFCFDIAHPKYDELARDLRNANGNSQTRRSPGKFSSNEPNGTGKIAPFGRDSLRVNLPWPLFSKGE